jgi:hypothetical protein
LTKESLNPHINSAESFAMALYSDSVLDRDTVGYFLELRVCFCLEEHNILRWNVCHSGSKPNRNLRRQ